MIPVETSLKYHVLIIACFGDFRCQSRFFFARAMVAAELSAERLVLSEIEVKPKLRLAYPVHKLCSL